MSEVVQVDAIAACRLFIQSQPMSIDEPAIRSLFGGVVLGSMDQVADAMGVAAKTVRNTWRRDGMPGEAKRGTIKANKFPLAEIVIWHLRKLEKAAAARGKDEYTDRKRAAETMSAEIDAQRKQREFERQEGQWMAIEHVRSQWNAALGILSNDIMGIPRDITPVLCKKCSSNAGGEITHQLRLALTRVSERQISDLEVNGNGQGQNGSRGINGHSGAGEVAPR
ncbi:MAG: hypothetical protein AB7G28_20720 [Pirellulales bacterium]